MLRQPLHQEFTHPPQLERNTLFYVNDHLWGMVQGEDGNPSRLTIECLENHPAGTTARPVLLTELPEVLAEKGIIGDEEKGALYDRIVNDPLVTPRLHATRLKEGVPAREQRLT